MQTVPSTATATPHLHSHQDNADIVYSQIRTVQVNASNSNFVPNHVKIDLHNIIIHHPTIILKLRPSFKFKDQEIDLQQLKEKMVDKVGMLDRLGLPILIIRYPC